MRTLVSLLFACTTVAAQQQYWVDASNGSNSNSGAFDQPFQTLSFAVANAGPNTTIHVQPGLYGPSHNGETIPITLGAIPQQNLVIRGLGGSAVFDLGGSINPLFRLVNGAHGARITGLTISNSDQLGWWTRAIQSGTAVNSGNAANNVEIDRCRFLNLNRGIVLWTADNVQGWRIHDNLFVNLTNDAILEYTGTNEVANNTFVGGAYKACISDSTTTRYVNNLVMSYAIAFENNVSAYNGANHRSNWVWQCPVVRQGAGFASGWPASNVTGQDPMLVNPGINDFRPAPGSPLIDRGDPGIYARADLDGVARLVDSDGNGSLLPEIGCHESSPLSLSITWDAPNRLYFVNANGAPGTLAFVLFAFDDGLLQVPGQGPILLDQATFIPSWLTVVLPTTSALNLGAVPPLPPGTRVVNFMLGIAPNHQGAALLGSNQTWTYVQ